MNSNLSKLDLAFVMDTTSSMSTYINKAKQSIVEISDKIKCSEKCQMRLGLVNYRDHPPQDSTYVTETYDLTDDILKAKAFISKATAHGGGDFPEAICCALNETLNKLKWSNESVKVAVLIADAVPHGLGICGDGFPNGCPLNHDPIEIVHKMAERGITLYTIGCEPALKQYREFFIAMSLITGGKYVPLNYSEKLAQAIIGGTREEVSMERLMQQVNMEVMKEAADKGKPVDEEELTKRIHKLLNSKAENKINKMDGDEIIEISEIAREASKYKTLKEAAQYLNDKKALDNINAGLFPTSTTISFGFGKVGRGKGRASKAAAFCSVPSKAKILKRRVYKSRKTKESSGPKFPRSSKDVKEIIEIAKKKGPRRSSRLNVDDSANKAKIDETKIEEPQRILTRKRVIENTKEEEKAEGVEKSKKLKTDDAKENEENINLNEARRLVKKSIARNKIKTI